MSNDKIETQEKKVEYLELIYDLIFVYLIGRNNSILQYVEDGFVPWSVFLSYILCMLAIIQIWNFTTFYINLYGRNGIRDHVFLFVNMFLLYHMADGIHTGWQSRFYQFCIAWALILANIGLQHIIEMRYHRDEPRVLEMLRRKSGIIMVEVLLVLVHMFVFSRTGISIAYVPILFGIAATALSGKVNMLVPVDFPHLSERAMLYVVFTFGEMVISITGYFENGIEPTSLYFSTMAFLIVAGLFLSYEVVYNRIIDRNMTTNGTGYMMIHVFLIFALNNISVALEFMRNDGVALLPKVMFITGSFVVYFICLFLLGLFSKKCCRFNRKFRMMIILSGAGFFALMFVFMRNMYMNIAISVIFVMAVFLILFKKSREAGENEGLEL
ncbi:MAG: low temperature requirement protein A [Lachnospiraceae bacterium]|nr:low temperature requirement protein A [Lachnospiraceae bacterium]